MDPDKEKHLREFQRPIILGIAASVLAELVIFVVYGVVLYPAGNWLHKFFWTVVFCGIGMGATVGALVCLLVVGRWSGLPAILATATISLLVLGLGCNLLCFSLDRHFRYFGGGENPLGFWSFGIISSGVGGACIGWLLFSKTGPRVLQRLGI